MVTPSSAVEEMEHQMASRMLEKMVVPQGHTVAAEERAQASERMKYACYKLLHIVHVTW